MNERTYNIAVIGGGPAGIFSAGFGASNGANVVLVEKNKTLGKKFLITGKGRCNITNKQDDIREFIEAFNNNGRFLYSALNKFNIEDTIRFFNNRDLETKVERGNRIFPVSDKSDDVLRTLIVFLKENNVNVLCNTKVLDIIINNRSIKCLKLQNGEEVYAEKYIICTGGLSYPSTGSSGDGYKWSKLCGHTIIDTKPSLVPITVKEKWIKDLQGLSLKNVNISVFQNNKKCDERFGEALFTHEGLSGPIILDMSQKIGSLLKEGVKISIDFKPALDYKILDARILKDFQQSSNKMFKNSLDKLLPKKLIPVIIKFSRIDPDKKVNVITKEERKRILKLLKEFSLNVKSLNGFQKAIITSGGVNLKEIDPRSMRSKIIDNLYFAGEILDLDGPTGGYNLQVCWSTGYLAGISASLD